MKVTDFKIAGPLLIETDKFSDNRGFFVERYRRDAFCEVGLPDFIQDNFSRSVPQVLRGLHFQYDKPQSKLITVLRGHILDVAVDIRKNSPTFGRHLAVEIHEDCPAWLWVPAGFAHGFQVLGDSPADVLYKVDAEHSPAGEGGIRWNDRDLDITWRSNNPIISVRDQNLPSWASYTSQSRF